MTRGHTLNAIVFRTIFTLTATVGLSTGFVDHAGAAPGRKIPQTKTPAKAKPKYNRDYVIANFMRKLGNSNEPYVGKRALVDDMVKRMTTPGGRANVLLRADAGSGKDAIVEEVAKILSERDGHIFELDIELFIAGVESEGELKARWTSVLAAFIDHPNEWLFLNEIHRLQGMGSLKDSLKIPTSNGRLKVIGAGTPTELLKSEIDQDPALMSRFEIIDIPNATYEELLAILRKMKADGEEKDYGVSSTPGLLKAAARAALEFFPNEPLIRTTQDLYRGTLAMVQSERTNGSRDLRLEEDRKEQLDLELGELEDELKYHKPIVEEIDGAKIEKDSFDRKAVLNAIDLVKSQLKDVEDRMDAIRSKDDVRKLPALQDRYLKTIADLTAKFEKNKRLDREDYDRLLRTQNHLLPSVVLRMQMATEAPGEIRATEHDLARVVARKLGVAPDLVTANVYQRVRRMEAALSRIQGHEEVKKMILDDVRRTASQMAPINTLAGLYVLDGATGSGKTELAEAIAEGALGTRDNMLTISFAELHEFSVMRVLGSGAGLVNSDEGSIYDPIRTKPAMAVNADEIDKTHKKIINLHQRIFDKGKFQDARNRKFDFHQVWWIGTSNYTEGYAVYKDLTTDNRAIEIDLGLQTGALKDLPPGRERDDLVLYLRMRMNNISASMSSRLRNRRVVDALKPDGAREVTKLMANKLVRAVAERKQWTIQLEPGVTDFISDSNFSWWEGGRHLQSGVDRMLQGNLSYLEYNLQKINAEQLQEVAKHNAEHPEDKKYFRAIEPGVGTVITVELTDAKDEDGKEIPHAKALHFALYVPGNHVEGGKPGELVNSLTVPYPIVDYGPEPKLTMADVKARKAEGSTPAPLAEEAPPERSIINEAQLDMFPDSCQPELSLGTK